MTKSEEITKEKPSWQHGATASFGLQLTGNAGGSQPVLLLHSGAASLLLIGSFIFGMSTATWFAGFGVIIGAIWVYLSLAMWRKSQPSVDSHLPTSSVSSTISIKPSELTISGESALVHTDANRALVLEIMNRIYCQKPLPSPVGNTVGNPSDITMLVKYTSDEATAAHKLLNDNTHKDRELLIEKIANLKEQTNLPSRRMFIQKNNSPSDEQDG